MQLFDEIEDGDSGQHQHRQGGGEDGRMTRRLFPTAFRTLDQGAIDEPFRRFLRDRDACASVARAWSNCCCAVRLAAASGIVRALSNAERIARSLGGASLIGAHSIRARLRRESQRFTAPPSRC